MQQFIVDANMTKREILKQNPLFECPHDILAQLVIVEVLYYSFDEQIHQGQIVIHKELSADISDAFSFFLDIKFPINSVIPISNKKFHWDDELSMRADNTTAFNYRTVIHSTRLSHHAFGRAIDINPRRNPFIHPTFIEPQNGYYDITKPGVIVEDGVIVAWFKKRGWEWGGYRGDYQHFEKPL